MKNVMCCTAVTRATPPSRKPPKRTQPAGVQEAQQRGHEKPYADRQRKIVAVLPHHQRVFSKIGDVVEGRLWIEFEQDPANVRVPETLGDVVGIIIVIDVLMMATVIGDPRKRRVLKGSGAENQRHQANRPKRLKRHVGKQPVITERDAEPRRNHEGEEHRELKCINSVMPKVHGTAVQVITNVPMRKELLVQLIRVDGIRNGIE